MRERIIETIAWLWSGLRLLLGLYWLAIGLLGICALTAGMLELAHWAVIAWL